MDKRKSYGAPKILFDNDSASQNERHLLTVNEHYAKTYALKKEREELSKLKDKHGSDVDEEQLGTDSEDDEDDETEDEEGEELTPVIDAAILRTLARIKRKDAEIYDAEKGVFEEEQRHIGNASRSLRASKGLPSISSRTKPLLLRQHAVDSALQSISRESSTGPDIPTHREEQNTLRSETIQMFHRAASVEENEDDDLLVPREKLKEEIDLEDGEYHVFLKNAVGQDIGQLISVEEPIVTPSDNGTTSDGVEMEEDRTKKDKKGKPRKEESDHEFLMNYILNRGWVDRSTRHVPTYSEVTGVTKNVSDAEKEDADAVLADDFDDEEFDEVADTFESSYNFRFEEPGAATVAVHPRNVSTLVRRQDTSRKEIRQRKKERNAEKLLQKQEEVKRMKALMTRRLGEKLQRIGKEGGMAGDDVDLSNLDLDDDWNPEAHDQQMARMYDNNEGDDADETKKPTWDDDVDQSIVRLQEKIQGRARKDIEKMNTERIDEDFAGPSVDEEGSKAALTQKRKRREYMDEVDDLGFNDMIGEVPVRFNYTPVLPETYGLSPVEILMATDQELNQYVNVKKYAPYRKGGRDPTRVDRLKELKGKLKERWQHGEMPPEQDERPMKKRKGKKERQKAKSNVMDSDKVISLADDASGADET